MRHPEGGGLGLLGVPEMSQRGGVQGGAFAAAGGSPSSLRRRGDDGAAAGPGQGLIRVKSGFTSAAVIA